MATLTINAHDAAAPVPALLEQRFARTEPKSPEALAEDLAARTSRTEKLRTAHLDAVKDRAARESQRAAEAAQRKVRLQHHKAEKVQRRIEAAETKSSAKKEAAAAEREARKVRREAMALAVAEAREEAVRARTARAREFAEMEELAFAKHSRAVATVVQKATWQVKHALEVVETHKERLATAASEAAARLSERLEKAAASRDVAASPPRGGSTPVRHRVLNDEKVMSEMRRKLYDASMEKAASKREAILKCVAEKAGAENAKAASVAARAHAKSNGTDAASVEAKAALFHKLLAADVARETALKSRAAPVSARRQGDTVSVIVVKLEHVKLRMPPPELSQRLSVVTRTLVATAAARQAGAKARRQAFQHAALHRAAKWSQRRAAALARVGKTHAAVAAKSKAAEARALINCALGQGKRLHGIAQHTERLLKAGARRDAAKARRAACGAAAQALCNAAAERRAAALRKVAKTGVLAVRHAAFTSRREALRSSVLERAAAWQLRRKAAESNRATLLAERVALAQKHMKARHPKREVADMEVKETAA